MQPLRLLLQGIVAKVGLAYQGQLYETSINPVISLRLEYPPGMA